MYKQYTNFTMLTQNNMATNAPVVCKSNVKIQGYNMHWKTQNTD